MSRLVFSPLKLNRSKSLTFDPNLADTRYRQLQEALVQAMVSPDPHLIAALLRMALNVAKHNGYEPELLLTAMEQQLAATVVTDDDEDAPEKDIKCSSH